MKKIIFLLLFFFLFSCKSVTLRHDENEIKISDKISEKHHIEKICFKQILCGDIMNECYLEVGFKDKELRKYDFSLVYTDRSELDEIIFDQILKKETFNVRDYKITSCHIKWKHPAFMKYQGHFNLIWMVKPLSSGYLIVQHYAGIDEQINIDYLITKCEELVISAVRKIR